MAACKYDSVARRLIPKNCVTKSNRASINETSPAGQIDAATSASETDEMAGTIQGEVRHARNCNGCHLGQRTLAESRPTANQPGQEPDGTPVPPAPKRVDAGRTCSLE